MNDRRAEREGGAAPVTPPSGTLRGRWLVFVRVAWVAVAVLVLGLDAAGIPYTYAKYKTVCTGSSCVRPLNPHVLRELHDMGLSAGFFAASDLAILIGAVLVYCAVASVIFWRGPNDRMALYASFALLVFGTSASASDMPQSLAAAHPALWFPVYLLFYLGEVSFIVFFYLFPDGRFVPRWFRWLAVATVLLFVPNAFFRGSPLDLLNGPLFLVLIVTPMVRRCIATCGCPAPSSASRPSGWSSAGLRP